MPVISEVGNATVIPKFTVVCGAIADSVLLPVGAAAKEQLAEER
jgi:hypothetical protein